MQKGQLVENSPDTGRVVTPISTDAVDVRFFTAPLHLDRRTMLTDSFSVGQAWSGIGGRIAPTVDASLGLTRTFPQKRLAAA